MMIQWIKAAFARRAIKTITAVETLFGGITINRFCDYESYLLAGSKKVWATWRACDLVAQAIARTPFKIVREGSTTPVKIPGLMQILKYPNQNETFTEFVARTAQHLKLTGNAYWYKSEATMKGERPKELYTLNPKRVEVVTNKVGDIVGYLFKTIKGERIPYDPEEVIHFRLTHPNNDYYGLGEIEAGEDLFNDYINGNLWAEGWWKNGANPSGILFLEDQFAGTEEQWQQAKAKWAKEYGGQKNSGKTAWLTGKWRYQQLGLSSVDMQKIESSKWNVEQIFMLHGIPLSVAGIRDAANFATAEIDNIRFKEYTVLPLLINLRDSINTDLIAGYGDRLQLEYEVSGLISVVQVMTGLGPVFDRGGVSINEMREKVGLARIDDPQFDQHYISSVYTPLELAGIANQQATQQAATTIQQRAVEALLLPSKAGV